MNRQAPNDKACAVAWDKIMSVARDHCLVVQAYGGVATLATPEAQREGGIRKKVLQAHVATEDGEQGVLDLEATP